MFLVKTTSRRVAQPVLHNDIGNAVILPDAVGSMGMLDR